MYALLAFYLWLLSAVGIESPYCAVPETAHPACPAADMSPPPESESQPPWTASAFISNGF